MRAFSPKRMFSVLLVAAVCGFSASSALAVLPHTHGEDQNHSKHATCPVHQAAHQGFHAAIEVSPSIGSSFEAPFLASAEFFSPAALPVPVRVSRAPPLAL